MGCRTILLRADIVPFVTQVLRQEGSTDVLLSGCLQGTDAHCVTVKNRLVVPERTLMRPCVVHPLLGRSDVNVV